MAEAQQAPAMKYTVTHYRQPGKSHEEFIAWLTGTFLPLSLPVLKRHGLIGYSLFVTPPFLSDALKAEMAQFYPNWDIADFDCILEYTIPSMQVMKDVVADPDWVAATKGQDEWVNMQTAAVALGFSTTYLTEKGEIVNLPL